MKITSLRFLVLFVSGVASLSAATVVDYSPIADAKAIVTGVRATSATTDSVVLTANYETSYAGLYLGSLAGAVTAPSSSWYALRPTFANQTVTAATFYGPNTPLFDPSIPAGEIIAVGSYKYSQGASGPNADHGLLYEGPVTGTGTWTQIDATPLIGRGETLLNTIAHSTMGNLVVGNYDTSLKTGKAFIYNRVADEWVNLDPANSASVTAYGIWQNGGSASTSYTIAGGFSDVNSGGVDKSYLVNYDSVTHALSNFRTYTYDNQPPSASLISHFDGITGTATGFNLTGDFIATGSGEAGFFASVPVNADGSFGTATWTKIAYTSGGVTAPVTSGNTVVGNTALGIFVSNGGTQSYIATVNPALPGVALSVVKSGPRATFTITNTGNITADFFITEKTNVTTSGGTSAKPPTPRTPRFTVSYTLNGDPATNVIKAGTTISLPVGGTAKVVEKVAAKGSLKHKRTIRTTLTAATGSTTATGKATLVLKPN